MTEIAYIEAGEPVDEVVSNRPTKDILTLSGLDPDDDFAGFLSEVFLQEAGVASGSGIKTLNFTNANLTPAGTVMGIEVDTRVAIAEYDNGNSGTTKAINFLAQALNQKVTMTGNCTFTLTAPLAGEVVLLKMIQDATGGRTVTWPASVKWGTDGQPVWVTTAAAVNIVVFYYDGTNYWGKALTLGG